MRRKICSSDSTTPAASKSFTNLAEHVPVLGIERVYSEGVRIGLSIPARESQFSCGPQAEELVTANSLLPVVGAAHPNFSVAYLLNAPFLRASSLIWINANAPNREWIAWPHSKRDHRRLLWLVIGRIDVEQILINAIAGALGGVGAGKGSPTFDLGMIGNVISGLVGGGLLGQIVTLLLPTVVAAAQSGNLSVSGIVSQAIAGGAGGAILTAVIGAIKNRALA